MKTSIPATTTERTAGTRLHVISMRSEVWFFRRAEGFYTIDVPVGSRPEEHARLNPGTLEITRLASGELLWGEACA